MKEESEKEFRLTDFDYLLADPHIQMMKAAIPFMRPQGQRFCSVFIKIQELVRIRTLFANEPLSAMSAGQPESRSPSMIEMLQAIKPYANPQEQDIIDMLENIQLTIQTIQTGG
ncbi:MAG: hypothetical protein LUE86_00660 [Clostridiales bacterium]|nr:hypothetical protein [Clostridiales bacterium]